MRWYSDFSKTEWIVLLISVALLAFSLGIDFQISTALLKAETAELAQDKATRPFFRNPSFFASLLRDLGLAGLVALLVGALIEKASRKRQEEDFNTHLQNVSQETFKAVIGHKIPESIVDKVLGTVLRKAIIRENSRLKLRLSDIPGRETGDYILLNCTHQYILRNLSSETVKHTIKIFKPTPPVEGYDEFLLPMTVTIDGEPLEEDVIADGDDAIPNSGFEERFAHKINIKPNSSINVRSETWLLKEQSDTELWVSLIPSTGMEVDVEMALGTLPLWHVDALHSGSLDILTPNLPLPPFSERNCSYRLTDALLPYQGIHLWWRPLRG